MRLFSGIGMNSVKFVLLILLIVGTVNSQTIPLAEELVFSLNSGFYADSIQVSLSVSAPGAIIHYTLDCFDPTEVSPIYTKPIEINTTTVVRARTYQAGYDPGKIITHTYILNQAFSIPTLSLITDPSNLWGERGIYDNPDNRGDEWERPATIEFFEINGSLAFSSDVGIRIHGGTSRAFEKKSFRYYFRSEYGQSKLNYQLFKPKEIDEFKRFVTSASFQDAPGNSAYGSGTLLRDAVLHEIGRRIEPNISLGNRPVALFLVGKPWGIYNAIERIDQHLLEINFGIKAGDIIENFSEALEGTRDRWDEMIAFLKSNDLSLPQNYEIAQSLIDIQNFTRYYILEIYGGNMDWPDYNNFSYRGFNPGDKWQWILWDLDNAFAYISANTFELATDDTIRGTLILRKLLENDNYRVYFLNECADLFNTVLQPENVKMIIDSLAAIIRNDIDFEVNRWGGTIEEWENSIQFLKNFADQRPERLCQFILWELDVEDRHLLTVDNPAGGNGKVRINNIFIAEYPWQGYYFEDIPIELVAFPNFGFKFKGWSDSSHANEQKITLNMKADYTIYPVFELDLQKAEVVINEINYQSAPDFDPEDWVELYNPMDQAIDLTDWHFKDNDNAHDFKFPDGTMIAPKGFLVLCRNTVVFQQRFPEVTNYMGNFNFGLSGEGDAVRISHSTFALIDSVCYEDKLPWSVEADGKGATLELIDPHADNSLPGNWRASPGHGSPGKSNRYLPEVTSFVVKNKNDSMRYTNSRDVLVEMTDNDPDGQVVKWLINESPAIPAPDDFILTVRPANYHIESDEGMVTIFGWVLDNDRQVSKMTESSCARIDLALFDPMKIKPLNEKQDQPGQDDLLSSYPNPFNQATNIKFKISQQALVRLTIFNMRGEVIKCLIDETIPAGSYQISWDGRDNNGLIFPSGIYIVQVRSAKVNLNSRILLMK
jgi:hypothetical protein